MSSPPAPVPPASRRRPILLVFLLVVLLAGGGLYLLARSSRDRRMGLEAAKTGDFKKAEPHLKKAYERDPGDADVVEALARGYLKGDDAAVTDQFLAKWVELRPKEVEARKARFEFLRTASRYEDAYAEGKSLLELDPANMQHRRVLAGAAVSAGQFAEAEDLCRGYLREFPNDSDVKLLLANVFRLKGDAAAAVALLDELLNLKPPLTGDLRSRALLARAIFHGEADEPAKAIPLLREMLQIDPSRRRNAGSHLAVMLDRVGQKDEAEKVLAEVRRLQDVMTAKAAVDTRPDNLELRVRKGEELIAAGHAEDGVGLLLSVFDYDSKYRPAHRALAAHFEKTGQADRAAQHRRAAGDNR